jgi:hypothetical protein
MREDHLSKLDLIGWAVAATGCWAIILAAMIGLLPQPTGDGKAFAARSDARVHARWTLARSGGHVPMSGIPIKTQ